ncbi:myosin-binding striated muscle assembly central-domain-containing protein [Sordaria brevicollis]|uniref:Myosin-binding striated muscle assembly central-domain-containing protein n=1 Tax=Sordaria brevicollis TaxID=83679 RepID=A0AAE0P454_SORBR|nr:myosin-binding striated muscle assembly central-domain-containing protein [Sordaria brevicollis]
MASVPATGPQAHATAIHKDLGREDQTLLLFAHLMEGGKEDEETVESLGKLTKLLNDDVEATKKGEKSITTVIDSDCVDTILCYLDMRQSDVVRGHAVLCTSAYLKAAGDDGSKKLSAFFLDRVQRGTYDDYIVAFCVAATIFPIVPDLTSELFLSEGFLPSLGPLMRRKWKSRKVETACLEMLNAACMHSHCREAVQKYCIDWLEEIVDQDTEQVIESMHTIDPDINVQEGSVSMRRHSIHVQNLAAVVLTKLRAVQPDQAPPNLSDPSQPRVQPATTSVEDLSKKFTQMLIKDSEHSSQASVEGLAYASIRSKVKEELANNPEFLKSLVKTLETAPPRSPLMYGALSIFVNLTQYRPALTEEQKRISQLKAYADAAGKLQPDPLNDNEHVSARCKRVFEAGVTPVLVTISKTSSVASLTLVISILNSLSMTPSMRGPLAQQGAVRLLIGAWTNLPEDDPKNMTVRRTAAQALARILISTNPMLVFGGSTPMSTAIRPLVHILLPDQSAETRDLLPTFESLMALTNLAAVDDDTRRTIVRVAWKDIEELLLYNNPRITTAAVELVCNIVQSPEEAESLFADTSKPQAQTRLKILVALADAEDAATRSAAGGALAALTGYETVVKAITERERGPEIILGLCEDDNEDLRHRGVFVLLNMITCEGQTGKLAREKLMSKGAVEIMREVVTRTKRREIVELAVQALKLLLGKE